MISRGVLALQSGAVLESQLAEADMMPNLLLRDANRQLAVFIGGGAETLAQIEPLLTGRAYDVEFVAMDDEPYATIAALKPDLVVVNLDAQDDTGFQLLTMLRLDPETAKIPVLSYVQEIDTSAIGQASPDHSPMRLPARYVTRAQRH